VISILYTWNLSFHCDILFALLVVRSAVSTVWRFFWLLFLLWLYMFDKHVMGNKFLVTNCFWGKISHFFLISRRWARIWQWKLEIGYGFW
jgi:hypothetical protein